MLPFLVADGLNGGAPPSDGILPEVTSQRALPGGVDALVGEPYNLHLLDVNYISPPTTITSPHR
jgi:hypothetical protein